MTAEMEMSSPSPAVFEMERVSKHLFLFPNGRGKRKEIKMTPCASEERRKREQMKSEDLRGDRRMGVLDGTPTVEWMDFGLIVGKWGVSL